MPIPHLAAILNKNMKAFLLLGLLCFLMPFHSLGQKKQLRGYLLDEDRSTGHRAMRAYIDSLRTDRAKTNLLKASHQRTKRTSSTPPLGTVENFGASGLKGFWRYNKVTDGSHGHKTDVVRYDSTSSTFYAVSHGRLLLAGKLQDHSAVEIQNQQTRIATNVLICEPTTGRLLAQVASPTSSSGLAYSEDKGKTWTTSSVSGVNNGYEAEWGAALAGTSHPIVVLTKGRWGNHDWIVLVSLDHGNSYQEVKRWPASTVEDIKACNPYGSDKAYFAVKGVNSAQVDLYSFDGHQQGLVLENSSQIEITPMGGTMVGTRENGTDHLYMNCEHNGYHYDGNTWSLAGNDPLWTGLMDIDPNDYKHVIFHAFSLKYTPDGGQTYAEDQWALTEYGWDPRGTQWVKTEQGEWVFLFGNDFGIHFTTDLHTRSEWKHINKDQIHQILHHGDYSDKTGLLVTENQDRGTLTWEENRPGELQGKLTQTADGLRACIANTGNSYWFIHYWGILYHDYNPADGINVFPKGYKISPDSWYTPPMAPSWKAGEDAVFFAGYDSLYKAIYDPEGDQVLVERNPFNFRQAAGDRLYGVATTESDPNRIYAVTTNGVFFYSLDHGATWAKTAHTGSFPSYSGPYWGSSGYAVAVSPSDPNFVCVAGNGSSTNAFLISRDGGKTFSVATDGMTRYWNREITISPDGKYVFGTNQMVYVVAQNKWYDLRGSSCPVDEFTTGVEYISSKHLVRYFTYGVGVLDLVLEGLGEYPTVKINNLKNLEYHPEGKFTFKVDAEDLDGNIAKVDFYQNGTLIASKTTAPYEFEVNLQYPDTPFFQAYATDNNGNISRSAEVHVRVLKAQQPDTLSACKTWGVKYELYVGTPNYVPDTIDLATLTAVEEGVVDSLEMYSFQRAQDHTAARFTGYLRIEQEGFYQFSLGHQNVSCFKINGDSVVVNTFNPWLSGLGSNEVFLKKGDHLFDFQFWKSAFDQADIVVNINRRNQTAQLIGASQLLHESANNCVDCEGNMDGTAYLDACAICVGGNTGQQACDPLSNTEPADLSAFTFEVYPNPSTGRLHIASSGTPQNLTLEVYNAMGRLIERQQWKNNEPVMNLDLSGNPAGLYFVKIGPSTKAVVLR